MTLKPVPSETETFRLDPVEQAIRDIAAGRPVVGGGGRGPRDRGRARESGRGSPPRERAGMSE
ncbi:hypothetical protein ACFXPJ_15005 [Streptomyces goshikiensis]